MDYKEDCKGNISLFSGIGPVQNAVSNNQLKKISVL